MSDGVDPTKSQECHFIVKVVGSTSKKQKSGQTLVCERSTCNSCLEGGDESSSFGCQHHGNKNEGGHGSEDGVQVLCVEVLSNLLSTHGLLGQDSTKRRGDVGKHGSGEGEVCEGEFFHGGDTDSSDDGEEGRVDLEWEGFSKEESVGSACDDGFGGLDDVCEGDGSGSKGNDGSNVNSSVAKGDGEESLQVVHAEFRSLAKTKSPKGSKVEDTSGHLDGGNSPWESEGVESLLVVDVVSNVEEVPESEVASSFEGVSKVGSIVFLGDGGGSTR
mmetsp:Transcript_22320/g.48478  ORF Transcript_22320/g.48478 Transcript_22320/m.48478 type:complete len:274 (+) Transcript_22320:452-1273(+)